MIAPFYLIFLFISIIPIFVSIALSFTNYDLYQKRDFIGLANYIYMFTVDDNFFISLRNTIVYTLLTVFPVMSLGLVFAVVLNQKIPGLKVFRSVLFLPRVLSMVTAAMIWLWMYDPTQAGILNRIMHILGLKSQPWLGHPTQAMAALIIMSVWKDLGYTMIIYLAGLQLIPGYLYEAATIEGAGPVRQFFSVTIPLLKPTTFFIFVTSIIRSFNVFEQVMLLTEGGPLRATTTLVHQIYKRAFDNFRMGYASSLSVIVLIVLCVITLINFRYSRGADIEL